MRVWKIKVDPTNWTQENLWKERKFKDIPSTFEVRTYWPKMKGSMVKNKE